MPTDRFTGLVLGTNLTGTDNADGSITIDATGGGGAAPGYGTSLPGSPSDGDEYILVDSTTTPTYQWRFRYNSSGGTYKWEFVGGSTLTLAVDTDETITSAATWMSLSGPAFTAPRAGIYLVGGTARYYKVSGSTGVFMGGTLNSGTPSFYAPAPTATGGFLVLMEVELTAAASDVIRIRYFASAGTDVHVLWRRLTILPRMLS